MLADLGYAGHLPPGVGPVLCTPHTRPRSWLTWTRSHGISPAFQFTLMSIWNGVAYAAVHREGAAVPGQR
jgi:hypothetical protein